jgi:hypothetical protein
MGMVGQFPNNGEEGKGQLPNNGEGGMDEGRTPGDSCPGTRKLSIDVNIGYRNYNPNNG